MISVTANLTELAASLGVSGIPGYVTIRLTGSGEVYRAPNALLSESFLRVNPDANGDIALSLYGNDVIQPAGTAYELQLFSALGSPLAVAKYRLTGSSAVDLSAVSPL